MNNLSMLKQFILPLIFIAGGPIVGSLVEKRGLKLLSKLTQKTNWKIDEILLNSIKGFTLLWFTLGGFYLATAILPLNQKVLEFIHKGILATVLFSAIFVISKLAVDFIRLYSTTEEGSPMLTSLFETLTKIAILSIGFLIVLQSIGIAITPLITALGVGGISLSLALKSTLSNFISGINIITSKKIRPGDYIKLQTGEEGYVTDVELKYTVIQEIDGNLVVIPNEQLISSSFKNYALPERLMLVPVEVGVSYDSDLEEVEAVTLEVAKETMENILSKKHKSTPKFSSEILPEKSDRDTEIQENQGKDSILEEEKITSIKATQDKFKPFLRYNQFGEFSINFTVYLQTDDFFEQLTIKHEFIKRLYKRYQKEGVKIPFPIYDININQQIKRQTIDSISTKSNN